MGPEIREVMGLVGRIQTWDLTLLSLESSEIQRVLIFFLKNIPSYCGVHRVWEDKSGS